MTDMAKIQGFAGKMLLVIAASIVLIIAVVSKDSGKYTDYEAYAIAVGAVAATLALIVLILLKIQPEAMRRQVMTVSSTSIDMQHFIAAFLCLWWMIGTSIITFKAPFTVTSNGYFAAWAGLFASAMALGESARMSFDGTGKARGATICLLVSAAVVVAAIAILHEDSGAKEMADESIFGIVSGCFTILSCLLMLCIPSSLPDVAFKIFAILLVLLWIATAGVLTFRAPFIYTGNGYFASWAGLVFAFMLFSEQILNDAMRVSASDIEKGTMSQRPGGS